MEEDASRDHPASIVSFPTPPATILRRLARRGFVLPTLAILCLARFASIGRADTLESIHKTKRITCGSDMEGGAPYIYLDPENPNRTIGFEKDLFNALAADLGAAPVVAQGQWDTLLQVLDSGRVDIVMNGYEWTEEHALRYLSTRPYYVYRLQLMARADAGFRSWSDFTAIDSARPRRRRIGVLRGSVAERFARENGGSHTTIIGFDGATDAMEAVVNGQIEATLQDVPSARFYVKRMPKLRLVGDPVGRGYYVIYLRKNDVDLKKQLDHTIERMIQNGSLRTIYERYDVWNDAQVDLASWTPELFATTRTEANTSVGNWAIVAKNLPLLLKGAATTVLLAVASMPLATAIGLILAIARLYGPRPARFLSRIYIEIVRGTPLMLQLYVLFFLFPRLGLTLDPIVAAIAGLAINYSAYEAEIHRAALQAIPIGQFEAALALGMSRGTAIRLIIIPQAARIATPAITNDFIALFKDTSVCSAITLVELTKQYNILALSTGAVVEFAATAALFYLLMGLPFSWLSRRFERNAIGAGSGRGIGI